MLTPKPRFSVTDLTPPPRKPSRRERVINRKLKNLARVQSLIAAAIKALKAGRHNRGVSLATDATSHLDAVFCDD